MHITTPTISSYIYLAPFAKTKKLFNKLNTMAKLSVMIWVVLVITVLFQINLCTAANKAGDIGVYELKRGDFSIKVTNYGATVLSVMIPDKNGLLLSITYYCSLLCKQFAQLDKWLYRLCLV